MGAPAWLPGRTDSHVGAGGSGGARGARKTPPSLNMIVSFLLFKSNLSTSRAGFLGVSRGGGPSFPLPSGVLLLLPARVSSELVPDFLPSALRAS